MEPVVRQRNILQLLHDKMIKPSPEKQHLTSKEILSILPALTAVLATGIFSIFTGFFRRDKDAPTLRLHVAFAVLRKATRRLSPKQLQLLSPTTEQVYEQWARSVGCQPETVVIAPKAKGHWIGSQAARHVLIWYHGGGFAMSANIAYFKFLAKVVDDARSLGKDVAVFLVAYSLAPDAQYPIQLTQSVAALRHILVDTGRTPSQVFLGGDSAGGNLAFGVLSHLAHKCSEIEELTVDEPLAGAVTIAPWTNLTVADSNHPGEPYCGGDLITPHAGRVWSRGYLGSTTQNYFTDASLALASWFEVFPVRAMLVLAGSNEIMLPDITALADTVKIGLPFTELFVGEQEAHVAPIYNLYVGSRKPTEQGGKLQSWLMDLL